MPNDALPLTGNNTVGLRTLFGTWLPPGAKVAAYVGPQSSITDSYTASSLLVQTLNEGLARARSGKGDYVVLLPGFAESISAADYASSLVAGTKIVGIGEAGQTTHPTLTWTATASSFLLDVADVAIENVTMVWNGIDNVVAPITVSAAGCSISNCNIIAQSASAGVLKGVEVGVLGTGFRFRNNSILGVGEAQPMTSAAVLISGATNDVAIEGNYICTANPGTAALGLIAVTAAATNVRIRNNHIVNLETAGTALFCVTVGDVAATGVIANNYCKITSAVTATTSGVEVGTAGLVGVGMFENYCADVEERNGVLAPVATT